MESWKNVTNTFVEKYQLELPQDIIFDTSALFDLF